MTQSSARISDVSGVTRQDSLVPLYRQDPDHHMPRAFVSDAAYAEAVAGMVIVCADVVIVDREAQTFYLTTRRHLPMAGLWWIGGRVRAGEAEIDAIMRNFARETGLDLPADRFTSTPLVTRYMWSEREQEPQNLGSDNLCYNFTVTLTAHELVYVIAHLDPEEYDADAGLQVFGRAQLESLLAEGRLHPVIWKMYQQVFGA